MDQKILAHLKTSRSRTVLMLNDSLSIGLVDMYSFLSEIVSLVQIIFLMLTMFIGSGS